MIRSPPHGNERAAAVVRERHRFAIGPEGEGHGEPDPMADPATGPRADANPLQPSSRGCERR
jgi:hypothetical protein